MKNFWPHRSTAKGFLIEKLARKYREKRSSVPFDENSNQPLGDINLNSSNEFIQNQEISCISIKKEHWANRGFWEYKEAA